MYKVTDCNALMSMCARGNVQQQTHRSVKAGEFKNKLHEDMNLDDPDLTSYPTTEEIVDMWHAGRADATGDCDTLGMRHADVTDDTWNHPWEWDRQNPRASE